MKHWLTFLFLLVSGVLLSPGASAESEAAELKAAFVDIDAETGQLLSDVALFTIRPSYVCAPQTPNKDTDKQALQQMSARYARLRGRLIRLKSKNQQYGRAGEGQVGGSIDIGILDGLKLDRKDLTIGSEDIARIETNLRGIQDGLRKLQTDLRNAPPPDKDCDPQADPIRAVTIRVPGPVDPGAIINLGVSATTASGKAVTISKITVLGAGALAEDGAAPAYTVNGLGTAAPSIRIAVAKIRADQAYVLSVQIEGRPVGVPGPGFTLGRTTASVQVNNVAPQITSAPFTFAVEPGETVSIDGQVTIVDRNADKNNVNEIDRNRVRLTQHPATLKTSPRNAFSRWSSVSQVSFDPTKGEYVFKVKRDAAIETPHEHGIFEPLIRVMDSGTPQNTIDQSVSITVKNVPPKAFLSPTPRDAFHSNDNMPVGLIGVISDGNGADDIEDITIDARDAGGAIYKLTAGSIKKTTSDKDGFSFKIDPESFAHTTISGPHKIMANAVDGKGPQESPPNNVPFETEIHIGNDPPVVGAIGYMTGTELIITKEVCPRGLITVGAQVSDREADKLTVTATILPGGAPKVMKLKPGSSTFVLVMLAPDKPGTYTIRFDAAETGTREKKTATRSIELIVKPCGSKDQHPQAAPPPVPVDVVIGGPPGADVQVQTVPPALPGEPSLDWDAALAFSELFYYGWALDQFAGTQNDPEASVTNAIIDQLFNPFITGWPTWQEYTLLEDHGGFPPACGAGPGTGPTFNFGPNGPENTIGAIQDLNAELQQLIESSIYGEEQYQELMLGELLDQMAMEFGTQVPVLENGTVVPRTPVVDASAAAAKNAAVRAQLQSQYDALVDRQTRMNGSLAGYQEQLDQAIKDGDTSRAQQLRGFISEITEIQASIHNQTTPIIEQMNELDRPQQQAQADELSEVSSEINDAAWENIANRFGFDDSVQDAKQWTTWVTRWVSVGSGVSYGNDALVRQSTFSLVSAEEKLDVVDELLEDTAPGSFRETVLNRKKVQYETQRDSAQQHLDSLGNITSAGYVIDAGLYASGAVVVNLARKAVVGGATRVFGAQVAERTAVTLDTGLIQLTKQATGRASTSGSAATASGGTSSVVRESSEVIMGGSSEATTGAFNTAQAAGETGFRFGSQGMDEAWQAFEAARITAGAEIPSRMGNASPEWGALWVRFADDVFDDVVGQVDDVILASGDDAFRAHQALERAGAAGRQAFRSDAGQAAAQHWDDFFRGLAEQPNSAAALERAREVAGQRGVDTLMDLWKQARLKAEDDALESMLDSSAFYGLAPVLFGLLAQDASAAEAPQTTLDANGQGQLRLNFDTSFTGGDALNIRLEGGGPLSPSAATGLGPCREKKEAAQ